MRALIIASIVAVSAALSFAARRRLAVIMAAPMTAIMAVVTVRPITTTATGASTTKSAITSRIAGSRKSANTTITAIWSSGASGSATEAAFPQMLPSTKPAVRPAGFSSVKSIALWLAWKHCETKNGKITEISCCWTSLWRSFNLAVAGMTANARMKPKEM